METTSSNFHCFHCGALVPESEIAGGWCETCGKKLPESIRSRKKSGGQELSPAAVEAPAARPASRLLWGVVVVAALAVAAFLVLTRGGIAG